MEILNVSSFWDETFFWQTLAQLIYILIGWQFFLVAIQSKTNPGKSNNSEKKDINEESEINDGKIFSTNILILRNKQKIKFVWNQDFSWN